ncbi:MAG TPA: hypothetical protein VLC79_01810 [Cellvibrio sp.]|nr:hypothetical protein [Cellvibrio sp.]
MNNMLISYWQFIAAIIIVGCVAMYGSGRKSSDAVIKSEGDSKVAEKRMAQENHAVAKPGAAVRLKDTEPLKAAQPGKHEYQLQLISPVRKGKMTVDVSSSDNSVVILSSDDFEFALEEAGEYLLPLALNVSNQGRFYIQLQISISSDDQPEPITRVISVILQVGEPEIKMRKAAAPISADGSEGIIVLPAQETISSK